MESPSFRGLKLYLRYQDRSIEDDVRRVGDGQDGAHRLHRPDAGRRALPRLQQRAARDAPLAAEERLRGQREPRAEDAAGPHPPVRRDPGAGARAERGEGAAVLPRHQQGEPAPDPAHQQHPRLLAHRGRPAGSTASRPPTWRASWTRCWRPTASRSSSRASRSSRASPTTCPRSRSTRRRWARRSSTS